MYAGVKKDVDIIKVETKKNFEKVFDQYEEYKRGYETDINYPNHLTGISLN